MVHGHACADLCDYVYMHISVRVSAHTQTQTQTYRRSHSLSLHVYKHTHTDARSYKQTHYTFKHKHMNSSIHIPVSEADCTETYKGIFGLKPHSADVSTCLELLSLSNRYENLQMSLNHEKRRCRSDATRIEFMDYGISCVCSLGDCVSVLVVLFAVYLSVCVCIIKESIYVCGST